MPIFLISILFAAVLFMTPLALLSAPINPSPAPAVASAPVIQMHYTKGGIVQINTMTGATRFTPYRLVPELDRRSTVRA